MVYYYLSGNGEGEGGTVLHSKDGLPYICGYNIIEIITGNYIYLFR